MSTFRRWMMSRSAMETGVLIHQWKAESGIVNNGWRDEVRNSPYSRPIDWLNFGAKIENGSLLVNGDTYLFSNNFSSTEEKFGKFWRVDIEVESLPTVYDNYFYLLDMGSVVGTGISAADSLSFKRNSLNNNAKLYSNLAVSIIYTGDVSVDNIANVSLLSFGVADAGNGNGLHFVSINRGEKVYNSKPFKVMSIGDDILWSNKGFYIGRAITYGYYKKGVTVKIKSISIYKL